jgi:hypothetical protein
LTEDIFTNVFGDADFHRSNNIARELENVIETFMTREVRKNHLRGIEYFYRTRLGHYQNSRFISACPDTYL